jgi:hypothetical protein
MQRRTNRIQFSVLDQQLEVQLAYLATETHSIRLKCGLPFRDETYRICMGHTKAGQSDLDQHDPRNAARGNSGYQFALPTAGGT